MSDIKNVSLTKMARETLSAWQKLIDENGIPLKREGMKTCLNLEIIFLQLVAIVEDLEKQNAQQQEAAEQAN